ncbi:MAG: LysR family transcriptional regulator [Pseudomonadota bacterium]
MSHSIEIPKYSMDQLNAVYAVGKEGAFRAGARALNTKPSTVKSRVEKAEELAGEPFFVRQRDGVQLTPAGEAMLRYAEKVLSISPGGDRPEEDILFKPGQVTIAAPGAIGTYWLTPHLSRLCDMLPVHLAPAIVNDTDLEKDRSAEADIAIRYSDPTFSAGLKKSYLGTVHMMLHASRNYLKKHGTPQTPREVLDHWFIEQDAIGAHAFLRNQIFGNRLNDDNQLDESYVRIKTHNASVVYEAVLHDQGIAAIPTYVREVDSRIVPIEAVPALDWPFYYYLRQEAAESPSVRTTIEWLTACFDPVRYPYFAPEYVHPDEIEKQRTAGTVVPLFSSR